MSCDGWEVGDRCRARAAFAVIEQQIGGTPQTTTIDVGDEGVVTQKLNQLPEHMLYVLWQRFNRNLPVNHLQMHLLEKI